MQVLIYLVVTRNFDGVSGLDSVTPSQFTRDRPRRMRACEQQAEPRSPSPHRRHQLIGIRHAEMAGLEPAAFWVPARCSADELDPLVHPGSPDGRGPGSCKRCAARPSTVLVVAVQILGYGVDVTFDRSVAVSYRTTTPLG